MTNRFRAIAWALLALAAQPLAAQQVRGRVVEWGTGRAVPFATVTVLDAAGRPAGYAQSDAVGEYSVRLRSPGRYFMRAEHLGYQPATTALTHVREGRDARRNLALRPRGYLVGRNGDRGRIPGVVAQPLPGVPPVTGAGPATSLAPRRDGGGDRPVPRTAVPAGEPREERARAARRPPRQPGGDRGGARRGDPQPSTRQP